MSAISRCSRISCILRRVHTISRRSSVLSDSNWKIISKGIHQPPKLLRYYFLQTEKHENLSRSILMLSVFAKPVSDDRFFNIIIGVLIKRKSINWTLFIFLLHLLFVGESKLCCLSDINLDYDL